MVSTRGAKAKPRVFYDPSSEAVPSKRVRSAPTTTVDDDDDDEADLDEDGEVVPKKMKKAAVKKEPVEFRTDSEAEDDDEDLAESVPLPEKVKKEPKKKVAAAKKEPIAYRTDSEAEGDGEEEGDDDEEEYTVKKTVKVNKVEKKAAKEKKEKKVKAPTMKEKLAAYRETLMVGKTPAQKPPLTFKITGTSFHTSACVAAIRKHGEVLTDGRLTTAHRLELVRDPTNAYDSNAIKVMLSGEFIGHVPKNKTSEIDTNAAHQIWGFRQMNGGPASGDFTGQIYANIGYGIVIHGM
jgi:hypothetical protein